ncbi:Nuclear distribution protein nudE-like 1 [Eumeta japonica]|uniref:Nuclear distribution protein nudE-like 1 n=1 Tax=Eumeta variegata TaxID=151549 RepID=A0A4C1Y1T6_EUMVA|nr:Nuclear distribution protein nudE-like 1 [Eumeta japonica]
MDPPRVTEIDSLEYWKKQAKHYEQKANDIQQELDEYTENSAQLEKELEASLGQVEQQNKELVHQNQRLKNDIELLRNKLERSQHEANALESEIQALKVDKDKQSIYIRELEQKNDDLERGQRVISESVSYIEALLNQAYERNAVLESEVDEVENLRVKLQRATDEARDLKQELKVIERMPVGKKEDDSSNENLLNGYVQGATRPHTEIETQTIHTSQQKREINGNGMTQSTRVSAINIVGDLLRKVGLERFLCRECGKVKCACNTMTPLSNLAVITNNSTLSSEGSARDSENTRVTSNEVEYRCNSLPRQTRPTTPIIKTRSETRQALESKLASCRSSVRPKEHSPNPTADVGKDYRENEIQQILMADNSNKKDDLLLDEEEQKFLTQDDD